jgi:hypothetical protein
MRLCACRHPGLAGVLRFFCLALPRSRKTRNDGKHD